MWPIEAGWYIYIYIYIQLCLGHADGTLNGRWSRRNPCVNIITELDLTAISDSRLPCETTADFHDDDDDDDDLFAVELLGGKLRASL